MKIKAREIMKKTVYDTKTIKKTIKLYTQNN